MEVTRGKTPSPPPPITTAGDLRFVEWSECRAVIGRLDSILVDLRKIGFAFITALITASSFLSLLGIQISQTALVAPTEARAAAFIAIMVLIGALFALDCFFEVLLSGAVERALDLETLTDPPVRLTKYLSINTTRTAVTVVSLVLYLALLVSAGLLGLLAALTTVMVRGAPPTLSYSLGPWNLSATVIAAIGTVLFVLMGGYWIFIAWRTGLHTHRRDRHWRPKEDPAEKVPAP